jgi:hypothetical protein
MDVRTLRYKRTTIDWLNFNMSVVLWAIVYIESVRYSSLDNVLKFGCFFDSGHTLLSRIEHLTLKSTTCLR